MVVNIATLCYKYVEENEEDMTMESVDSEYKICGSESASVCM